MSSSLRRLLLLLLFLSSLYISCMKLDPSSAALHVVSSILFPLRDSFRSFFLSKLSVQTVTASKCPVSRAIMYIQFTRTLKWIFCRLSESLLEEWISMNLPWFIAIQTTRCRFIMNVWNITLLKSYLNRVSQKYSNLTTSRYRSMQK